MVLIFLMYKHICIPESFNTNISLQLFDYIMTFVSSKGDFVPKKTVLNVRFKDFWFKKINLTQIWYSINEHLALKIP